MRQSSNDHEITIRDLYPHLNGERLKEAQENFDRYIELELRVYERILADPVACALQSFDSFLEGI